MFGWHRGADGIVVITMDDPDQAVNTANQRFQAEWPQTLGRLEAERETIRGVILASAKKTFFAGADLMPFSTAGSDEIPGVRALLDDLKAGFRRLELLGVPVVAAINGAALGGGCELSLACHHRIAVDRADVVIGLPEVNLGLLPGAGGVARTVRMFGIARALTSVLLPGTDFGAAAALKVGLVDEVVADEAALMAAARAWIEANPVGRQPWDERGFRIPGGTPAEPRVANEIALLSARLRREWQGAPADAGEAIFAAAVECAQVDFESAQLLESRYCAALVGGQVSSNIIKGTFFEPRVLRAQAKALAVTATDDAPLRRIHVLGDNSVSREVAGALQLAGLEAVVSDDPVPGADLVIESGDGPLATRISALRRVTDALGPGVPVASNTSWVSLAELSPGMVDVADLVGLHFFMPVARMGVVELAVSHATGDHATAAAASLALAMRKTAIKVGDAPGFYANQVMAAILGEAIRLLGEGVPATSIERCARQAGWAVGPLALMDALSLPVTWDLAKALGAEAAVVAVLERMVEEFGRVGRSDFGGFYDYHDGRRRGLWAGLSELTGSRGFEPIEAVDLRERLLFAGSLAAIACLDAGVVTSAAAANVGSLQGIGFPTWTGGTLRYVEQYAGGVAGFARRAEELAAAYVRRFAPPSSLRERIGRVPAFA